VQALELKLPPPVVALFAAVSMWFARSYAPSLGLTIPSRPAFAIALGIVGIALSLAGVLAFRKAKTTVNPTKPETTSTVVATGVYRLTRNPMYLGMLVVLVGWAVFLANAISFLVLPLFVLYINRFQIGPEERVLSEHFGSEYASYMKSVRRWL
jgi:protein-S-isoprenylcysteine O-methyltransferase Ste14